MARDKFADKYHEFKKSYDKTKEELNKMTPNYADEYSLQDHMNMILIKVNEDLVMATRNGPTPRRKRMRSA